MYTRAVLLYKISRMIMSILINIFTAQRSDHVVMIHYTSAEIKIITRK